MEGHQLEPREAGESPPLRRGSPRPRSSERVTRLRRWLWVTGGALVLALGGTSVLYQQMDSAQQRLRRQVSGLRDSLQVQARSIEQLEDERRQLVEGRIPGLQVLQLDAALDVPDAYVRNVIFSLTGLDARTYEYRIVLENTRQVTVKLAVRILLFDAQGVQIGEAQVSWDRSANLLGAGEVRAWSGVADHLPSRKPEFFMVVSAELP